MKELPRSRLPRQDFLPAWPGYKGFQGVLIICHCGVAFLNRSVASVVLYHGFEECQSVQGNQVVVDCHHTSAVVPVKGDTSYAKKAKGDYLCRGLYINDIYKILTIL